MEGGRSVRYALSDALPRSGPFIGTRDAKVRARRSRELEATAVSLLGEVFDRIDYRYLAWGSAWRDQNEDLRGTERKNVKK